MNYDETKAVGARVFELRSRRELTQRELGEQIGASFSYVCRVESGQRGASATMLQRFADALGTSAEYLATGTRNTVELALQNAGLDPDSLTAGERDDITNSVDEATFAAALAAGKTIAARRAADRRAELEAELAEMS